MENGPYIASANHPSFGQPRFPLHSTVHSSSSLSSPRLPLPIDNISYHAMNTMLRALALAVVGLIQSTDAFSSQLRPYVATAPQCQANTFTPVQSRATRTSLASTAAPATANSGVTIGDTKGANLLLTDLFISTGDGNQILKSINFRVDPKERWGIVGPNGCGERCVFVCTSYFICLLYEIS